MRGPPDTPFERGLYHGRILLPPEYPFKAPEILILTPNGRFEVNKRICLSITSYHQETWQPSWGIRTILTALVGYLPSEDSGVGSLDFPAEDRRVLARKSRNFQCRLCGVKVAEQFQLERELTIGDKSELLKDAPTAVGHYQRKNSGNTGQVSASSSKSAGGVKLGTVQTTQTSEELRSSVSTARPRSNRGDPSAERNTVTTQNLRSPRSRGGEKELLYLSYAIAAVIVFIIARRAFLIYFSV